MRFSAALAVAALVVGSSAASCPYAERAAAAAAAPGCPYAKRAAEAAAAPAAHAPKLSKRGPIEGKKGIFYSEYTLFSPINKRSVLIYQSEPYWTFRLTIVDCQCRW